MTRTKWWLASLIVVALGSYDANGQTPEQTWCGGVDGAEQSNAPACERKSTDPLRKRISLAYHNTPCSQIFADLSDMCGIRIAPIVTDKRGNIRCEVDLSTPLSLVLRDTDVWTVLETLAKKMSLEFRASADGYVHLFHVEPMRVVSYPVADLIVPIQNGPPPIVWQIAQPGWRKDCAWEAGRSRTCECELVNCITRTIAPKSWRESGGKGTIAYYPLGAAIVIEQTPEVHGQLRGFLDELRRAQDIEYTEYSLTVKMVELRQDGKNKEQGWPKVTFVRQQRVRVAVGTSVAMDSGTVADFLRDKPAVVQVAHALKKQSNLPPLEIGDSMQFKLTGPIDGPLTLDMTIHKSELEEANKDGIVVAGKTYRLLRQVQPGRSFKIVLERDEQGDARRWLEGALSQPTACCEQEVAPPPRKLN